ncbi:acetyltransferase [Citrobacter cronae]|uniref:acetyltransferase n=1 Tax=Citrobacter cronae TaxID=1748967 RepID=UPI001C1107CA|nr:acetyltransferase [Citrobacter cronae]MBU5388667.1 acetyltransferase [Citrobacter cronae]
MDLLPFLLDMSQKEISQHAIPLWWKRREVIPCQLPPIVNDYLRLDNALRCIQLAPGCIIDESLGKVLIGEGTKICHGAFIQGPAVIGSNCLVGNYSFIRSGTIIGNNVKIGFATEIKNSLIESETQIGPQCFVSDSVICKNVYLGAQVRTSNHRLDEQHIHVRIDDIEFNTGCEKLGCYIGKGARLGIQVIILPGRHIAANTFIGPRITVEHNLKKGRYVLKQNIYHTQGIN